MLRVTKLTDYASVVMTVLATRPDEVLSATELAKAAGLEPPTVSKLLKPLAQAGLVEGLRGVRGGYRLTRPATEISLIEIVEAMEGPLAITECSQGQSQCGIASQCGVRSRRVAASFSRERRRSSTLTPRVVLAMFPSNADLTIGERLESWRIVPLQSKRCNRTREPVAPFSIPYVTGVCAGSGRPGCTRLRSVFSLAHSFRRDPYRIRRRADIQTYAAQQASCSQGRWWKWKTGWW